MRERRKAGDNKATPPPPRTSKAGPYRTAKRRTDNKELPPLVRAAVRACKNAPPEPGTFTGTRGGVMAFDLGAKTGWAAACAEGKLAQYARIRLDLTGAKHRKLAFFRESVEALIRVFGPSTIAHEAAMATPHRGSRGGRANWRPLLYYEGVLAEVCEARGIRRRSIYPPTLKKWSTGNGRASKDDLRDAARKRWNIGSRVTAKLSDDVCDALCVLSWAIGTPDE